MLRMAIVFVVAVNSILVGNVTIVGPTTVQVLSF